MPGWRPQRACAFDMLVGGEVFPLNFFDGQTFCDAPLGGLPYMRVRSDKLRNKRSHRTTSASPWGALGASTVVQTRGLNPFPPSIDGP
jgi:hypothetical protein